MGRRIDGFEDDRVSLAEAEARRAIRVRGVDQRQSPSSYELRCVAGRQEGEGRTAGVNEARSAVRLRFTSERHRQLPNTAVSVAVKHP